jgi:Na+/H+-translocating membrane pyrophosphatase
LATAYGVLIGMFQNNADGAWDNAKKKSLKKAGKLTAKSNTHITCEQ